MAEESEEAGSEQPGGDPVSHSQPTPATIFPSLSYDDAAAAIDWLCLAFGFRRRLVVPGPEASIRHSELSLGAGVIMVGSARPAEGRLSPRNLQGLHQVLSVYVEDPDAHCTRARAAGAAIVQEPAGTSFGARGYLARDPEGHHWFFANYRPGVHWEPETD